MAVVNLQKILETQYPAFFKTVPKLVQKVTLNILKKIVHQNEINKFLFNQTDKTGFGFIDEIFEYLNFSFTVSHRDYQKIPSEGKLIIVSNHPLGGMDGLALLKAVQQVRTDIKIIGNSLLANITNLDSLILPYNLDSKKIQKENILNIFSALEKEEAVIIFPAAEVSRLKFYKIRDGKWHNGAIHFAKKHNAPVLPVFVEAKNSPFFYLSSGISKMFSTLLLPHELFKKRNKTINIKIGNPIPAKAFKTSFLKTKIQTSLLKKHVYKIGKGESGIFKSQQNVIHPVKKIDLKHELQNSEILGVTNDGMKIYLVESLPSPNIMNEIARLRELTFRSVEEGTGKKLDLDKYDNYYKHIIVWDENELEIVGSYRIGIGSEIFNTKGISGFYTESLFNFSDDFITDIVFNSIELGRSFVQKKYWNSSALNYLWQGVGAFIARNENVKYLFGAVSISNSYKDEAKKRIIYFYNKWFGSVNNYAVSKNRYIIPEADVKNFISEFNGENYKQDFNILKKSLRPMGFAVPVLFKHYSDLCYNDGCRFLDFGVDETFENCIDGLIVLEVDKIKPEKKERYINKFREVVI